MGSARSNGQIATLRKGTRPEGGAFDETNAAECSDEHTNAPGVLTSSLRLAGVPSAVAAARSFAADSMALWQVPSEAAGDAVLIVSEIVTNAVRAGGIQVLEPDNRRERAGTPAAVRRH